MDHIRDWRKKFIQSINDRFYKLESEGINEQSTQFNTYKEWKKV